MFIQETKRYCSKKVMLLWAMLDKILKLFEVLNDTSDKGVGQSDGVREMA